MLILFAVIIILFGILVIILREPLTQFERYPEPISPWANVISGILIILFGLYLGGVFFFGWPLG
jgi:threonine/homoserine/homoserine lactone efflux protein